MTARTINRSPELVSLRFVHHAQPLLRSLFTQPVEFGVGNLFERFTVCALMNYESVICVFGDRGTNNR